MYTLQNLVDSTSKPTGQCVFRLLRNMCCLFFFDLRILITPLVSSNSFYLGSDHTIARKKITDTKGNQIVKVEIVKGVGGYAKLKFALGKHETCFHLHRLH
jgi:hypothetical protein